MLNVQQLINFEQDILNEFENKQILSPIHLASNNEQQLIDIFETYEINDNDWVMCTWRSHYECLLKGVPPKELKQAILDNRSITLCFKKYKVLSSAIVGGICPIALGIALSLAKNGEQGRVFCFVGDMSAETGIFHECYKYGISFNLPIYWVVADNNKAVCTDTRKSWGFNYSTDLDCYTVANGKNIIRYKYNSKFAHAGGNKRVNF